MKFPMCLLFQELLLISCSEPGYEEAMWSVLRVLMKDGQTVGMINNVYVRNKDVHFLIGA